MCESLILPAHILNMIGYDIDPHVSPHQNDSKNHASNYLRQFVSIHRCTYRLYQGFRNLFYFACYGFHCSSLHCVALLCVIALHFMTVLHCIVLCYAVV